MADVAVAARLVCRFPDGPNQVVDAEMPFGELPHGELPPALHVAPAGAVRAWWIGWLAHGEADWLIYWKPTRRFIAWTGRGGGKVWSSHVEDGPDLLDRVRAEARRGLHQRTEPWQRGASMPEVQPGLRAAVSSAADGRWPRPWVAMVGGPNAAFGRDREFVPARLDLTGSWRRGTRGGTWWWTLAPGPLYEALLYADDGTPRRVFLRVEDGRAVEVAA